MIKRLSIAQKLVIVLVCLLVLFSVILTTLLIKRASADLVRQQSKIQTQHFKQYQLLDRFINDRIVRLIEGFSASIDAGELITFNSLERQLSQQSERLQLRWQVDNIWLLNIDDPEPKVSSKDLSGAEYQYLVTGIAQQQRPVSRVICAPECAHYLGVPILTQDTNLSIIGVQYALSELLASFAQSADANVATIVVPSKISQQTDARAAENLVLDGTLSTVNQQIFEQLIAQIPPDLTFNNLYQFGHVINANNTASLLNLLPISLQANKEHYLITVTDISESYYAVRNYYLLVIAAAIGLSGAFLLMVTLLLRSYRRKLENLSHRLPLLALNLSLIHI